LRGRRTAAHTILMRSLVCARLSFRTEIKSLISFGVIGSGSQFRGLEQSRR
jgi:hypothetical protein